MRHIGAPIVFLGLHEPPASTNALPSSDFKDAATAVAKLEGTPYFSLDVSELSWEEDKLNDVLKDIGTVKGAATTSWSDPRAVMSTLDTFNAAIYGEARSMLDWHQRNKV
jgi:NAD+ diphosphatase